MEISALFLIMLSDRLKDTDNINIPYIFFFYIYKLNPININEKFT